MLIIQEETMAIIKSYTESIRIVTKDRKHYKLYL